MRDTYQHRTINTLIISHLLNQFHSKIIVLVHGDGNFFLKNVLNYNNNVLPLEVGHNYNARPNNYKRSMFFKMDHVCQFDN